MLGRRNGMTKRYKKKRQSAARPSAATAKIFYEGKILEIIALIMQWEENQSMYSSESHIPEWESVRFS
jgi:hypothetical protein